MRSKLSLSSVVASLLPSLYLSFKQTHTYTSTETHLFRGQWAASKLRCAHGRAGTWKTKANMQAHIWLERITRFTQPSSSCREKANVEWNSIMCTSWKCKAGCICAWRRSRRQTHNYMMMNKEEREVWCGPFVSHWWEFLSRCCFPVFICPELGVCERLCDPSCAVLTQGCPAGPAKALCFYTLIKTFWRPTEVLSQSLSHYCRPGGYTEKTFIRRYYVFLVCRHR